jgi:hypothetical protein
LPKNVRTSANCPRRRSGFAILPLQPINGCNIYGIAPNRG